MKILSQIVPSLLPPATPPPQPPSTLLAAIDRVERSTANFDLKHARYEAGAIMAGSSVACTAVGQLSAALLPGGAALGVAAALSLGIAAAGALAANQVMHGVRNKGMLGGACELAFFMGFGSAGSFQQMGRVASILVPSAIGIATGALFGSQLETCHFGLTGRLAEARAMADKYAKYQAQHAELEREMAGATPPAAAPPASSPA